MEQAFTYMFKDNMFKQKFLYYFLFYFLSMASVGQCDLYKGQSPLEKSISLLIALLTTIIIYGYYYCNTNALIKQDKDYILAHFELKNSFLVGLKYTIATTLLVLAFLFTILIPLAVIFGIFYALNLLPVGIILCCLFCIVPLSAAFVLFLALSRIFAKTMSLTSFLRFSTAFKLIKLNPNTYWISLVLLMATAIPITIFSFISGFIIEFFVSSDFIAAAIISNIIYSLIVGALCTYISFVGTFLTAKSIVREE